MNIDSQELPLGQSISPWDFDNQFKNKLSPIKKYNKPKYNDRKHHQSLKELNQKTQAKMQTHSRNVMKLQMRVSTEIVPVQKNNPETKINPMSLFIKLPNNFTAFPPKKMPEKAVRPRSLTQRDYPLLKEKPSLRNFKKQIQDLTKLTSQQSNKISQAKQKLQENPLSKRYILRNVDLFEQTKKKSAEKIVVGQKKTPINTKKHILDRILSRFE